MPIREPKSRPIQTKIKTTYEIDTMYYIGALENSIHFVFDHQTKTCAIIDPAWNADLFIEHAESRGYKITDVWLTHWHPDHTNATDGIVNKTGAKVTIGIHEIPYLKIETTPDILVNDGDYVTLGNTRAKVIYTPGHTAGGVCYLLDEDIIVGDTLFVYGAGKVSFPGGSALELFQAMKKLKKVKSNVDLNCGHDYGCQINTTMGEQQQGNPFLLIEDEGSFVKYIQGIANGSIRYPRHPNTLGKINNDIEESTKN